jgi:hypothetical protein
MAITWVIGRHEDVMDAHYLRGRAGIVRATEQPPEPPTCRRPCHQVFRMEESHDGANAVIVEVVHAVLICAKRGGCYSNALPALMNFACDAWNTR